MFHYIDKFIRIVAIFQVVLIIRSKYRRTFIIIERYCAIEKSVKISFQCNQVYAVPLQVDLLLWECKIVFFFDF